MGSENENENEMRRHGSLPVGVIVREGGWGYLM